MITVISLGGSVFYGTDKIDVDYIKKFSKTIRKFAKKGNKFVIITGGGKPARDYIGAMKELGATEGISDMPAILITKANAWLVMAALSNACNDKMPENYEEIFEKLKASNIVVCGGFMPGVDTDADAASISDYAGAGRLINITNVRGVYDKDPKKFENARFIQKISYGDYMKLIMPIEIKPGSHAPFSLMATKMAQRAGIKICVIGRDIKNFENCASGRKFDGTIIG